MAKIKASYITDCNVKPELMILGLINANNNLSLTEAQVKFRGPTVISGATEESVSHNGSVVKITRNTSLDIDVLSDEVADDYVTFKYQRVNLATLFSRCNPSFLETAVAVGSNGLPVDMTAFIAELKRKFSVQFTEADFTYTSVDATHIKITAKPTNLAYIGEFNIAFMPILSKRALNLSLDGFEFPA